MTQNIFTECFQIAVGCKFYSDKDSLAPAPAGKYSDGTNCYTVNVLGVVTSIAACGG